MVKQNKLVICTVGTSISNDCPSQRQLLSHRSLWNDETKAFEREIQERISRLKNSNFRNISAEINSIDRLNISPNDKIVLLSSDNAPGRACSKCLQQVICQNYGISSDNVIIERIEGLQVYDSDQLKKIGLKNFIARSLKYISDKSLEYQYDIILNPTGGFKGVLPFFTILGMLYGKKTVYIFEFSQELIYLPPLPFTFDINIFERVRPALKLVDNEVAVTEEQFLSRIIGTRKKKENYFCHLLSLLGKERLRCLHWHTVCLTLKLIMSIVASHQKLMNL